MLTRMRAAIGDALSRSPADQDQLRRWQEERADRIGSAVQQIAARVQQLSGAANPGFDSVVREDGYNTGIHVWSGETR